MRSLLGNILTDKAPIEYTALDANQQGFLMGQPGYKPQLNAYELNSTLYSVVSFLAQTVAQVNWGLYEKAKVEDKRRQVFTHPALIVLNKPNNFITRQDLFEAAQQHIELAGEAWFIIEYAANRPVGIWLARPDRMVIVKSKAEFLLGYQYRNPDGSVRPLAREEVIQLKTPDPNDPYRGLSPVVSLLSSMYSDNAAERYQLSFMNNNAMPAGIMEITENMNDEQWKRNIERWKQQHQGPSNAGKVAFVEQGKFSPVAFTQNDMQFLELRGFTEDKIREAYGVSKAMLGVVDDVNRANNEAQQASFSEYKLKPRLEKLKLALNTQLLPLFGSSTSSLEFDYDDITVEDQDKIIADRDSKVSAAVALINAGADPIQTLRAFGLPEIPFAVSAPAQTGVN
jgi:HK97 family phage portal protein